MKKLIVVIVIFIGIFAADYAMAQQEDPPPPFNMSPSQAWSVFTENYRSEMYEFALPYGRWLIQYRPRTMEGHEERYRGDRNFRRMINIYDHMAGEQSDPVLKEAYIDSALILYDRALTIFTEDEIDHFRWKFDRSRFIHANASHIEDGRKVALEDYLDLYETDRERMVELGDGYYVVWIATELANNDERDRALEIMNDTEDMVNEDTRRQFNELRSQLFRSPEERISYLETQLTGDPQEDIDLKRELLELHTRAGNRAKIRELSETLYKAEPNYENIMIMVDFAERNAEYREAIRYLNEAMEVADSDRQKAELHHKLSDNYLNLRDLQRARSHARQAANLRSSWGEPLLRIAEIYAQAITECAGGQLDRNDKAVYWLVLDYLERAQRVDSSVASRVNRQIPSYRGVTPTAEEKFYQNWEEGDTLRIDGNHKSCYSWIDETTTVR